MQYQLFPSLSEEEYSALKESISTHGVQMPIVVDEAGNVLDGHQRLRACEELGIRDYPVLHCLNLSEHEKEKQAVRLNAMRRQLTQEQRAELAGALRARGWTLEEVAKELGVSTFTVWNDQSVFRNQKTDDALPERVIGKDGKSYPTTKRPRQSTVISTSAREAEQVQKALALVGDQDFEGLTIAAEVFKLARQERNRQRVAELPSELSLDKTRGKYAVIYADPPWEYEHSVSDSRAIENQYPSMELAEICALPVEEIAHDDSVLFLWATAPKLAEGITVMEAWGFEYRTCMVWVKDRIGMGYYARSQHELLLIGRRGSLPVPLPENRPASVIEAPRTLHSEKPDLFAAAIETMYPALPRIELFRRGPSREGWDAWGKEASSGDSA